MAGQSRLGVRTRVVAAALANRMRHGRRKPQAIRRVLVAHHLLPGDTFMLTALLAKLREQHPQAEVVMTVPKALVPLYAPRPYGVRAVAFDPRNPAPLDALRAERGFDLALVPGDNRYSWLASALDARWVVAFAGDRPPPKDWMVDELRPYRATPAALGDMFADLVDGPPPAAYHPARWPVPPRAPFDAPAAPYAVLHVEASSPLKHWEDAKWRELAAALASDGLTVVFSAGPKGGDYLKRIDPDGRHLHLGHRLDLAQLWNLVAGATLLVCPDTSVSHMGKLTFTPTVTLYGPSSALLFGPGEFFRDAPFVAATIPDFPCRDQHNLFKRKIEWVKFCERLPPECERPRCMEAVSAESVRTAATILLSRGLGAPRSAPDSVR